MLFNKVDIIDIVCKMIINSLDNDIIIYIVIDVINFLMLNLILWVFFKLVEMLGKFWYLFCLVD